MNIIPPLITFKTQVKLYHWKTGNAIRHIVSDNFLKKLDPLIDKFVEVYLGSKKEKGKDNFEVEFKSKTDQTIVTYFEDFKLWLLEELPLYLYEYETDLFNIRDEILSEANRCLYLFNQK